MHEELTYILDVDCDRIQISGVQSAPSHSVLPFAVVPRATSFDYLHGELGRTLQSVEYELRTDVKRQGLKIYFCFDQEAMQVPGSGLKIV